MIRHVKEKFVCTWILIDHARELAKRGNRLARTLVDEWEYPLELIFLSSDGKPINKLNSFKDFKAAHADVSHPGRQHNGPSHVEVFLKHVAAHFGRK